MCTASWLKRGDSLLLFFNRDELRDREAALPPTARLDAGVGWVAPTDGRAHGTWIGATERGLALALLNRSDGNRPAEAESRGRLIPTLVDVEDAEHLAARLARHRLERFAPFRLLALWRGAESALIAGWDGERLDFDTADAELGLLCSSGLGDERATAARGAVWERWRSDSPAWEARNHREFHRDHTPEPSAWSVCVHRPEAATVSFTEIELMPGGAELRYRPGPPCLPAGIHAARIGTAEGSREPEPGQE